MDRATKSIVIVSTLLAASIEVRLAARAFGPLLQICVVSFLLAAALGVWARGFAIRVILFAVYLTPAAVLVWIGRFHFTFQMGWIAALLGLVLAGRGAWRWNIPHPWKWPIIAWALVVSVSWPIVLLRELDFTLSLLNTPHLANTSIGISPADVAVWTTYTVLAHNIGLLWIDWLFRTFPRGSLAVFRSQVLRPLAAGALIACTVGAYQGFVNIGFLSGHVWPDMHRAAGTSMDANVFGMIAALWGPAFVALAMSQSGSAGAVLGAVGLAAAFVGVWTSGSRTALLAMSVGVAAVLYAVWKVWRLALSWRRLGATRKALIVTGILIVAGVSLVILRSSANETALQRARYLIPGLGATTIGDTVRSLWAREGYGTAAVQMVRDYPWSGVGLGAFQTLVYDYAMRLTHISLPPDNAQNWYRHNFAELGLLGSLPWIAWCLLFLWALTFRPPNSNDAPAASVLKGPLIGFGLVSLVGMPGQDPAIVITFWTFAFWYLALAAPAERQDMTAWPWRSPRITWALVLGIVALHAAGTYTVARHQLSVPQRAVRFGWNYNHGFYDLERGSDGLAYRWTARQAVAVIPVSGRILKFEGWINHPDAEREPVDVRVWLDSTLVVDTRLRDATHVARDIPVPPGAERVVVRMWVSRTWRPSDHGSADKRELGVAIADWTFVDRPPEAGPPRSP